MLILEVRPPSAKARCTSQRPVDVLRAQYRAAFSSGQDAASSLNPQCNRYSLAETCSGDGDISSTVWERSLVKNSESVWRTLCGLRLRGSRAKSLLHLPGSSTTGLVWALFCGFDHCVSAAHQSTKQTLTPSRARRRGPHPRRSARKTCARSGPSGLMLRPTFGSSRPKRNPKNSCVM